MDDRERVRWARVITTAGWLFLVAYLAIVTSQIRTAFALRRASFEDGLWGQRIEQISFVTIPQNLVVLAPAAAAGVAASLIARGRSDGRQIWAAQLVRAAAGLCSVVIVLALLGVVDVFFRSPDTVGDVAAVLQRIGGILMSIAMIRVCLEVERIDA